MALANLKGVSDAQVDSTAYRALKVDEMRWLLGAAEATAGRTSSVHSGLTGKERAVLYRFGFETAIRPGKIRKLTVSSFDFEAAPATVTSKARHVKRRRIHTQQLTPRLAAVSAKRFKVMMPTAMAFKMPSPYHLADMLKGSRRRSKARIDEAGEVGAKRERRQHSDFLAAVSQQGERAVFYSMRHGHGTALADAGYPPEKNIGASMHHAPGSGSTKRYLHVDRESVASAIRRFPISRRSFWRRGELRIRTAYDCPMLAQPHRLRWSLMGLDGRGGLELDMAELLII